MKTPRANTIKELMEIPGVGVSIANDLFRVGIRKISDLRYQDPEALFDASNQLAGQVQDRCLLYVFRCAVYYAKTPSSKRQPHKLKWWNWKDEAKQSAKGLRR